MAIAMPIRATSRGCQRRRASCHPAVKSEASASTARKIMEAPSDARAARRPQQWTGVQIELFGSWTTLEGNAVETLSQR
jgi:hypothetical protein